MCGGGECLLWVLLLLLLLLLTAVLDERGVWVEAGLVGEGGSAAVWP